MTRRPGATAARAGKRMEDAVADCPRHSGRANQAEREPFDGVMRRLDENQSGEGRHKCPYCAYEQGRRDERRRIAAWLGSLPEDNTPPPA